MESKRRRWLAWARRRDGAASRLTVRLLDPAQPEAGALLALTVILLVAGGGFLAILEDVLTNDPLVCLDARVFGFLQALRTPGMDAVMVAVTSLGGAFTVIPVVVIIALWLARQGHWRTLAYWVSNAAFGSVLVVVIKAVIARPRPAALYMGLVAYSFPSGHATISAVVYGFLVILIIRQCRFLPGLAIGAGTALLVALIAFSRLYLGAHWLSDVTAGVGLGLTWIACLGIAYLYHQPARLQPAPLLGLSLAVMAAAVGFHLARYQSAEVGYAQARQPVAVLTDAPGCGTTGSIRQ